MKDKNGIEMRTGHIVEITGSYFKCDNGRHVIVHSPGDEEWAGKDYSLRKLSKKNELSLAKRCIAFWPLVACTNSHFEKIDADAHNRKHAQIEVVGEMAYAKEKDEIASLEREKKTWTGGDRYLKQIQERIDELKAKISA